MKTLNTESAIAQVQQAQPLAPLINHRGENTIYFGLGIMAIVIILTIGFMNRKVEYAIVFALIIAAVLILLATMV